MIFIFLFTYGIIYATDRLDFFQFAYEPRRESMTPCSAAWFQLKCGSLIQIHWAEFWIDSQRILGSCFLRFFFNWFVWFRFSIDIGWDMSLNLLLKKGNKMSNATKYKSHQSFWFLSFKLVFHHWWSGQPLFSNESLQLNNKN